MSDRTSDERFYRKKPVVIEARQLTRESIEEVKAWCGASYYSHPPMRAITGLTIDTLEGAMIASFGDWVIKGVKGEFYPCKPDIFEATYERTRLSSQPQESDDMRAMRTRKKLGLHFTNEDIQILFDEVDRLRAVVEPKVTPLNGRINQLRALRVTLKSGDYGGADIMDAWIALEEYANLLERANL